MRPTICEIPATRSARQPALANPPRKSAVPHRIEASAASPFAIRGSLPTAPTGVVALGHTGVVPELPDVEAARRFFARRAAGRRVERVVVTDAGVLRNASARGLADALRDRRFGEPDRLGKWLLCWTDGPGLILHFGMTGELGATERGAARHRWDRVIVELDDGSDVRYRDMRKLGGAWLALGPEEAATILGRLGPDALTISRRAFLGRLARRRGGVKAALMDQSFVAGVGNLLADEVLWRARLHPRRPIESLGPDERAGLHRALHSALRPTVDRYDDGRWPRTWLNHVRGLPGATCPRCRTPLERITAAGRTTWLCPACQRP
jgi:formamidopyrimidine-DNA glycosylase